MGYHNRSPNRARPERIRPMNDATQLEESLQRDIDLIRSKVERMAELAEAGLRDGRKALFEANGQMAYSVILRDKEVDELEKEIDRLCLEFLIRQQPAAGHLRFVYAVIKINQELERIGDYAESIARECLTFNSLKINFDHSVYIELSDTSISMMQRSLQAFLAQDADMAWMIMKDNEPAKDQRDQLMERLVDFHERGKIPMEALAPLETIARRYERVANQATNICEEILYMCTGKNMKHLGQESFRVLFVDDTNGSDSQMAEAIGNAGQYANFVFSSAGIAPGTLEDTTVVFLKEKGLDISSNIAKSIEHIPNLEHYQVIVALSKQAMQAFPQPPTRTVGIRWKIKNGDLEKTHEYLSEQIRDLAQAILGEQSK